MKLEEVDDALIEGVCERVRAHLTDGAAARAEAFIRQYYRWGSPDDLEERTPENLYGAALAHFEFARHRRPGETKVRVYNPSAGEDGWQSPHTAVEIVTDDMPFLIDSVTMELNRRGFGVHMIIHPVLLIERDEHGELQQILSPHAEPNGAKPESVIHAEVQRHTDEDELDELHGHLLRVLREVRAAVEDWQPMRRKALEIADELGADRRSTDAAEVKEFLSWLADDHFTFLGYREYSLH